MLGSFKGEMDEDNMRFIQRILVTKKVCPY